MFRNILRVSTALWLLSGWQLSASAGSLPDERQPFDTSPVLTLAEAEKLALERDEGLLAAQMRSTAQAESVEAANRLPDPKLRLAAMNYPSFGDSDPTNPMQQNVISISQAFPAGRTLALQKEKAQSLYEKSAAQWTAGKAFLQKQIRSQWLSVFLLKHKHKLLLKEQAAYREQARIFMAALRVGSSSQQDLTTLEARLAQAEAEAITAKGELDAARALLQRWLNEAANRQWPDALPALLSDTPARLAELVDHPELVAQRAEWKKTEQDAALARQVYKPRWSVDVSYAERELFDDMVSLGVTLEIPLFNYGKQNRTVRAREGEAAAARHEWLDRQLLMQHRYQSLHTQLQSYSARLQRYQYDVVPGYEKAMRLAQGNYQAGRGSYRDWLQTYEDFIEASLQTLEIQGERSRMIIEILYMNEQVTS